MFGKKEEEPAAKVIFGLTEKILEKEINLWMEKGYHLQTLCPSHAGVGYTVVMIRNGMM